MRPPKIFTTFHFFRRSLVIAALALGLATIGEYLLDFPVFLYALALIILAYLVIVYRFLQLIYQEQIDRRKDVHQVEALQYIYQKVDLALGLPAMRDYAASPDLLKIIIRYCIELAPKAIVEAGSGTSTVLIADFLSQTNSSSPHIALDHEAKYAGLTQEKLSHPSSKAVHAPLKTYQIADQNWLWYDLATLEGIEEIDLLFIDGPPESTQQLARYPALPLLETKLSEKAIIILDDTNRAAEQTIIARWCKEFNWQARFYDTEKGACVLSRKM